MNWTIHMITTDVKLKNTVHSNVLKATATTSASTLVTNHAVTNQKNVSLIT